MTKQAPKARHGVASDSEAGASEIELIPLDCPLHLGDRIVMPWGELRRVVAFANANRPAKR